MLVLRQISTLGAKGCCTQWARSAAKTLMLSLEQAKVFAKPLSGSVDLGLKVM